MPKSLKGSLCQGPQTLHQIGSQANERAEAAPDRKRRTFSRKEGKKEGVLYLVHWSRARKVRRKETQLVDSSPSSADVPLLRRVYRTWMTSRAAAALIGASPRQPLPPPPPPLALGQKYPPTDIQVRSLGKRTAFRGLPATASVGWLAPERMASGGGAYMAPPGEVTLGGRGAAPRPAQFAL